MIVAAILAAMVVLKNTTAFSAVPDRGDSANPVETLKNYFTENLQTIEDYINEQRGDQEITFGTRVIRLHSVSSCIAMWSTGGINSFNPDSAGIVGTCIIAGSHDFPAGGASWAVTLGSSLIDEQNKALPGTEATIQSVSLLAVEEF